MTYVNIDMLVAVIHLCRDEALPRLYKGLSPNAVLSEIFQVLRQTTFRIFEEIW